MCANLKEFICTTYVQEPVETRRGYWVLLALELQAVLSLNMGAKTPAWVL